MVGVLKHFNPLAECKKLNWPFWQCPPFLFIILGIFTVISMAATYVFASRIVEEPQMAAMIVIVVAAFFLIVGNFIIDGFNRMAEASRMKSEFISIFSHQLRSPLSISKWTLDIMDRETKAGNLQNITNSLRTLHDSTENMVRLVNGLLEVSRVEAGTFILNKIKLSLANLTKSILKEAQLYAEASNIKIEFETQSNLPEIWADRDRLLMVIHSLVNNAIRYSKGGGVVVISIKKQDSWLFWQVRDQGIGIPALQQKYIFQKFFRAANSSRFQTEGSGTGLYLVKRLIEALGGKVGFNSEEGRGSTFWFILPVEVESNTRNNKI